MDRTSNSGKIYLKFTSAFLFLDERIFRYSHSVTIKNETALLFVDLLVFITNAIHF